MKIKNLFAALFLTPVVLSAQINVKSLGAAGNGIADDWAALQMAIDSAVKTNGRVYFPPGTYNISKPLVVYNWNQGASQYGQATVQIYGDGTMWDIGNGICRIRATFKDGFALGIQQNKGTVIKGITFEGRWTPPNISQDSMYRLKLQEYKDTSVAWDRYGPYAGIVIDPFSGSTPSGGGYTTMSQWYRGPQTRSGSTGCRFEDITFRGWDIGAVTSPNGFTQNAEMLTFENIRVANCRIGFAGSQAQEKQNRLLNIGAWGTTHTLFTWTLTGEGHPGHWVVDGVNIAGMVCELLYRPSGSWFPLYVSNVFAESLGSIGYWQTGLSDAMSSSSINFVYPDQVKAFHFAHSQTFGVTFKNCNIRVYGVLTMPMVFGAGSRNIKFEDGFQYVPPVFGRIPALQDVVDMGSYWLYRAGFSPIYYRDGSNIKARVNMKRYAALAAGDYLVMVSSSDYNILGLCKVASVDAAGFDAEWISGRYNQSIQTTFFVYKQK